MKIKLNLCAFLLALSRSASQPMKNNALLLVGFWIAFQAASSAAVLVSEGFSYATGPLAGQNGGTGWEAAWDTTTPPVSGTNTGNATASNLTSLTYGPLVTTTGGSALTTTSTIGSVAILRDLSSTLGGAGSDLWMSCLINASSSGSGAISLLNSSVAGDATMLGIGSFPATSGYGVFFASGTDRPVSTSTFPSLGVSSGTGRHFMVLHLDMNTGGTPIYSAWLDPDFASLGVGSAPTGGSSVTVNTNTQAFTFDRIGLAYSNALFIAGSSFDEVRIGTSWVDVSPVSEPTVGMLFVVGVGMLTCVRRRSAKA